MLDEAESRLIGWGRWTRRNADGAAGYPRRTVEARLRDEGGVLISGTGKRVPPVDSAAEQIERLVVRLGDLRPDWRLMLVLYYSEDRTHDYVAQRLGVSESLIRTHWMKQAKMWVAGSLERLERKAA